MKSFRKELWFNTDCRRKLVNITRQVEECLQESGINEGMVLVNAMHITASVFINDDEAGLHHDYEVWLEKLAPEKPYSQYKHNGFEDNADAHLKRTIMGREAVVAVTNGKLDFGPWEQIFYGEFDGKRNKRVLVKILENNLSKINRNRMKNLFYLACITGLLLIPAIGKSIDPKDSVQYVNWQNQDPKENKTWGISTDKAYNELLKGKTSKTVIVAVIDNGVDIDHADLKDNIWVNPGEIPGNGIDDDHNGYIDDVHGWNFLGNSKGGDVQYAPLEVTRLYKLYKNKYDDFNDSAIEADKSVDLTMLNKVRDLYTEKSFETNYEKSALESILTRYNRFDSLMSLALLKKNYTLSDLKKFKPIKHSSYDTAYKFMNYVMKKKLSKKYLTDYLKYCNTRANYHYNLDYSSRTIIGDDPSVWSDTAYGNNDVKGPSPDHGTMVSGIIAATRNNGLGINGIADNVKIMVIRTIPDGDEYDKDVAEAIKYAIDNGAQIVNMSFGKPFSPQKKFVDDVVKLADEKNVLLIHAAGNDNEDIDTASDYPSPYTLDNKIVANNWLSIGANTKTDRKKGLVADFSNFGKEKVDLFAPGYNIVSCAPNNKYDMESGTSFSAPTVTGAAALVKEYYPNLTAAQLKDILLKSVVKPNCKVIRPGTSGKNKIVLDFNSLSVTGGIVNVYNALLLAEKISGKQ